MGQGLVDSHCHLDPRHFEEGADEVLERARAAGVERFVVIGVDGTGEAARHAVRLSERREDVWATVGVHPHDATSLDDVRAAELERLALGPRVVAVGEVGLDYHYMHSPREAQADAFRAMIALARRVQKPIVIHTREAAKDTLSILEDEGAREVGGIIHCFSEDRAFATRALDLGFDLSFSGIVTFKNAVAIRDVAAWAPAERILIETDSPYLAPVPLRGRRNEPANLVHTARVVAELRKVGLEVVARLTRDNATRRLGLASLPK
ncbi:MAG: TatD family deoxyribonuclease [Myxococcales bacterium]|nr:TatD family deoxyribonuclease [Myxococcales bacterium]